MADSHPPIPNTSPLAQSSEPRWRAWFCFFLTLAAIQLTLGPRIQISQWELTAALNPGVGEGASWLNRRLDLPTTSDDPAHDRTHDTAYFNGKVYNVFPPAVPILTIAIAPFNDLLHRPRTEWWPPFPTLLLFWPLPITGFLVFRRLTSDPAWAGLLTLGWMGGTALLPNLQLARLGYVVPVDHVISQTGLLILAADLLGKQRIWPALIGLMISAWSRQITCLYSLPLLWVAYQQKRLPLCLAGLAFIAAPFLILNQLKFGNPLQFGYLFLYVNRDDSIAHRAHEHGVFSLAFFPMNAWFMHLAIPKIQPDFTNIRFAPSSHGASIWFTSPLLLLVLIDARAWWRDPRRRPLMLATIPVMLGILCYHNSGFFQVGYNRFALDFIPIWLAVLAPRTRTGWRFWYTLLATAWAMLYFQAAARAG